MSKTKEKHLVVLQAKGFITTVHPKDKQPTDKVLYEGSPEECEGVIHGKRK